MHPIACTDLFSSLPDEWEEDLRAHIAGLVKTDGRKVVVLDDDPTGTQTVHGIPVLTRWSRESIQSEMASDQPAFYLLTNSRSMPLSQSQRLHRQTARLLDEAASRAGRQFVVVSRSDSTLRGHFPGELDTLAAALDRKFDGWILCPFFAEGGRYTVNDCHYVSEGSQCIPVAQTDFARDVTFGFRSSNLRQWVAEKSRGRIAADNVATVSIDDLRKGGPQRVFQVLSGVSGGRLCIVNAADYRDVEVFVAGLLAAETAGKSFLYRTAASFVQVLAGLSPQALLSAEQIPLIPAGGGLILVGSHVTKTTRQLKALLSTQPVAHSEIRVSRLLQAVKRGKEIDRVVQRIDDALASGRDIVVYTSRVKLSQSDADAELATGRSISAALTDVVRKIQASPAFILAKGGITASDVASEGLATSRAVVMGQIWPGVPVWRLGPESRFGEMLYIVFPGNVGDDDALWRVFQKLAPR